MRPCRTLLGLALILAGCAAPPDAGDAGAAAALHWTIETREARFLGSATAIAPGCLLTNRHVVQAAEGRPLVARRGTATLPVMAIATAQGPDAAVLQVQGVAAAVAARRADAPAAGEWLAVAGAQAGTPMLRTGTALDPAQGAAFGPQLRAARLPVAPGFSGAPVVDAGGRLVGIVVAAATGSLAEAQRLAAGRRSDPLLPRTALVLPVDAALAAVPAAARAPCGARPEPRGPGAAGYRGPNAPTLGDRPD